MYTVYIVGTSTAVPQSSFSEFPCFREKKSIFPNRLCAIPPFESCQVLPIIPNFLRFRTYKHKVGIVIFLLPGTKP